MSRTGAVSKIQQIEQIWFLTGETTDAVSSEDVRLALQTLSNFLQQDYLPEVVSQNSVMPAALFSKEDGLNYLPVPPVPRQESSYPGIFAVSQAAAYHADIRLREEPRKCVQPVNLPWTELPNSVSERWVSYRAEFGDSKWSTLPSPLTVPMEQWTPLLAEKIADLYESCVAFSDSQPRFCPNITCFSTKTVRSMP